MGLLMNYIPLIYFFMISSCITNFSSDRNSSRLSSSSKVNKQTPPVTSKDVTSKDEFKLAVTLAQERISTKIEQQNIPLCDVPVHLTQILNFKLYKNLGIVYVYNSCFRKIKNSNKSTTWVEIPMPVLRYPQRRERSEQQNGSWSESSQAQKIDAYFYELSEMNLNSDSQS